MTADDVLANKLTALAEQLREVIVEHEAFVHAGEPCASGRAKALAVLASRLGFANEAQVLLVAHHWSRMQGQSRR